MPNLPKNEHFLPPDTHFTLLPYYRRFQATILVEGFYGFEWTCFLNWKIRSNVFDFTKALLHILWKIELFSQRGKWLHAFICFGNNNATCNTFPHFTIVSIMNLYVWDLPILVFDLYNSLLSCYSDLHRK